MDTDGSAASLLRRLRREQGRSLRTTSTDLGLAPSQLSRIETGQRRMSPGTSRKLADYYGISPELIELADGRVPDDIVKILQEHPGEITRLRETYSSQDEDQ